jgi:thiol-disulfide isomerase/thioredoxin
MRLVLLAATVAVAGFSCSSGTEEEPPKADGKKTAKKKKKKKTGKASTKKPSESKTDASEGDRKGEPTAKSPKPPESPEPDPAPEAGSKTPLAWRMKEGERLVYQVRYAFQALRQEKVWENFRIDGTRFFRCTGEDPQGFRVVQLEPNPVEEIVDGKPGMRRGAAAEADFIVLGSRGLRERGGLPLQNRLLFGMAEPWLPTVEVGIGSEWTLERDFSEGRFLFRYRIEREVEEEGKRAWEIRLHVELPGGLPGNEFRLEKGEAQIRFDPTGGVLVKSRGELAFVRGEAKDADVCKGSFEIALYNRSRMDPKEAVEAKAALDTYFNVLELIQKKRYTTAERRIDEFETEDYTYAQKIEFLRNKIPDARRPQPVGLLDRKRVDFKKIPWSQKPGPSLYGGGLGKMEAGKPRTLPCVGQPAPKAWWKSLLRGGKWGDVQKDLEGKVLLIHLWMTWVPPCRETLPLTEEIAKAFHDKGVRLLGITLDTEHKALNEFFKKHKVEHPTVWDVENRAVKTFGLMGAPAFIVVDRGGTIRFGEMGFFGEETQTRIEEAIRACLK